MKTKSGTGIGSAGAVVFVLTLLPLSVSPCGAEIMPAGGTNGQAAQLSGSVHENIALGRPYSFDPAPNYSHCTDSGDVKQLTDGEYSVEKGSSFWNQKTTVGWSGVRPVVITVDLGRTEPICGISYNTAAGKAGVEWPRSLMIMVSDDGKTFRYAGDLLALSNAIIPVPKGANAIHRFRSENLRVSGRYVAFAVSAQGDYTFVDEIEVYRGDRSILDAAPTGKPINNIKAYVQTEVIATAIRRRILADSAALKQLVTTAKLRAAARTDLLAKIDEVERKVQFFQPAIGAYFKAILPIGPVHQQVFSIQAGLWKTMAAPSLALWSSGPYDPLSPIHPLPKGNGTTLRVAMMNNEYRPAILNISACGEQTHEVQLRIEGLPGGDNPPWVAVHEVAWTDTFDGLPAAAALPVAGRNKDGYVIAVTPGLTRQIWLTFHPADLPAGLHRGKIFIRSGSEHTEAEIELRIYPFRFPDRPTLHLGGWDYTDRDTIYDVTTENRTALIAHLREHFVDSPWAEGVLTSGKYDDIGRMISKPETAAFDRWLQRWPAAGQYCVFAAVDGSFAGTPMDRPEFVAKVGAWISFWAEHARAKGIRTDQLVVLLVDEPVSPKQDAIILAWAKAIRSAGTGIKVFEDPSHENPAKANQEMMTACHVLCPRRLQFMTVGQNFRDYYCDHQKQGTELAFYLCSGPVRLQDPYSYHRLQAWWCWQYGAKSAYFWAFGDSGGGTPWNEYALPRTPFCPLFLDARSVTAGKHMEAIREGVQDYEYLVMLRSAIADREKLSGTGPAIGQARKLLSNAAIRVVDVKGAEALEWSIAKDRSIADAVRIEILDAMTELAKSQ